MYILAAPIHTNPLLRCLAFHSVTLRFLHVPMFFLFLGSLRITYGSPADHLAPEGMKGRKETQDAKMLDASTSPKRQEVVVKALRPQKVTLKVSRAGPQEVQTKDWIGEDL